MPAAARAAAAAAATAAADAAARAAAAAAAAVAEAAAAAAATVAGAAAAAVAAAAAASLHWLDAAVCVRTAGLPNAAADSSLRLSSWTPDAPFRPRRVSERPGSPHPTPWQQRLEDEQLIGRPWARLLTRHGSLL